MSRPSVVLVAAFDDAEHAHGALRGRALERFGCDVTAVNVVERRGPMGLFRSKDLRTRLAEALRAADPDLVLVIGAPELDADLVASLVPTTKARWFNWFPDDLRTVDDALALAPAYHQVFAAGSDVAARLTEALHREVEVLPLACDPSVYRPLRSRDQQYRANVVFAGSYTPRREALLANLVEFGLAIWGLGWRKTSLRPYCRGETLRTDDFVRAYAGASVAVNIHHTADGSDAREATCNQRLFEIASIGVLQVVDQREDLERWFVPGDELLTFGTGAALKRTVEDALQDLPAAERIAVAGRQRLLTKHTYMHRMARILEAARRTGGPQGT
jgi:spore maturation protein CgeB